jgi:co-chaperonin GroES (HSP10)
MAIREQKQTSNNVQTVEQQNQETNELPQENIVSTTETPRYSLKDAEPLSGNIIVKVTNFDQPSTRYYYTPYPTDTNVIIYGEVIAADPNNDFEIKPGDHVLYNGSIIYQSIEDGSKYVVGPAHNVLLIWRSRTAKHF